MSTYAHELQETPGERKQAEEALTQLLPRYRRLRIHQREHRLGTKCDDVSGRLRQEEGGRGQNSTMWTGGFGEGA